MACGQLKLKIAWHKTMRKCLWEVLTITKGFLKVECLAKLEVTFKGYDAGSVNGTESINMPCRIYVS